VQVLIRWSLQRGTSVLPKSANAGRIKVRLHNRRWGNCFVMLVEGLFQHYHQT
jgi:hypothetical protein